MLLKKIGIFLTIGRGELFCVGNRVRNNAGALAFSTKKMVSLRSDVTKYASCNTKLEANTCCALKTKQSTDEAGHSIKQRSLQFNTHLDEGPR